MQKPGARVGSVGLFFLWEVVLLSLEKYANLSSTRCIIMTAHKLFKTQTLIESNTYKNKNKHVYSDRGIK